MSDYSTGIRFLRKRGVFCRVSETETEPDNDEVQIQVWFFRKAAIFTGEISQLWFLNICVVLIHVGVVGKRRS